MPTPAAGPPGSRSTSASSLPETRFAATLEIEPGTEVLVRDRIMFADDEPVQLATSYLPRDITRGTVIENEDTGPGGVYARLEETRMKWMSTP